MDNTFGRHRQSIADIENQLHEIFNQHPNTHINDNNEPVIPGDDLVDVLQAFSEAYNGLQLMTEDETAQLKALIQTNPGLEVTPSILLAFIAEKTKHTPPISAEDEDEDGGDQTYLHLDELRPPSRARSYNDNDDGGSSSDSTGPSVFRTRSTSQSGPPQTPRSASGIKSPFDNERRQRSTPLSAAPPSSWAKRPAPARRRKSMDAGSPSDSESLTTSPASFSASTGGGGGGRASSRTRSRAPSNPTSPITSPAPWSPNNSFTGFPRPRSAASISRPGSRAGSRTGHLYDHGYEDGDDRTIDASSGSAFRGYDYQDHGDDSFEYDAGATGNSMSARGRGRGGGGRSRVNTEILPTSHDGPDSPRSPDDDDEEEEEGEREDDSQYLIHRPSDASMLTDERVDALSRTNAELGRKLMDAERTLQAKLSEHELELEEMQGKLEEMRTELSATKREEKELRSKERQNMTQIAALEAEIAKVSKALESARSTYASLQRQYQEQCTVSERYRDDLRQREELIRNLRDTVALHDVEVAKWHKEQEVFESRIASLEGSLSVADAAHGQLEEQKQENLLLKETIDRMRFDMDELRNNAANNLAAGAAGTTSAKGSMSKSLGAELAGKMKWDGADKEDKVDGEEADEVESQLGNLSMESTTTIVATEAEDTEGEEDVIQTIITRKKKKVASRANQSQMLTQTFEETKEYSDSSTQYDLTFFYKSHSFQTDPEPKIIQASFSTQTEPPPTTDVIAIQTEPEPVPVPPFMSEMEIQTEPIEGEQVEQSRSPSPQEQPESMASSSSTIIPPTPKAHPHQHLLEHPDAPPSYNQVNAQEQEERELRALAESLKKWHRGVNLRFPLEGVPGGIPEEAIEEWKALQSQLGVGCAVIDKIVENSQRVPRKHPKENGKGGWFPFINIHNKIYFGASGASSSLAMWVGASALVLLAISPYMAPTPDSVPGGPTYYDRSAWSSFNTLHATGEGFSSDGTAAVWSFLGRVGGGAARIARGWPT